MEALKFAFNTLVVGALALPWLAVLLRMYFPRATGGTARVRPPLVVLQASQKSALKDLDPASDGKTGGPSALVSTLPEHTRDAVLSLTILALGYFLGVAISRISDDFFFDRDLWPLPTEPSIREDVYYHEYCDVHKEADKDVVVGVVAAGTLPTQLGPSNIQFCGAQKDAKWNEKWGDAITQFFRLEEGKLLLQGDDRTTRLRELHDQTVILRGAALNGMMLSILCLFGFCATFRHGSSRDWRSFVATRAPALVLVLYGGYAVYTHVHAFCGDPDTFRDPPLAEIVMVLFGIAGLLAKARVDSRWKYAHGCGVSFSLALVAYGAWWWTEVMYNQGVIHSYPTLMQ